METGDSLRLSGPAQLEAFALADAELLVWQMDRERGEL
jgi:hypothetical protein